jgi:signal transduction histidine kinase
MRLRRPTSTFLADAFIVALFIGAEIDAIVSDRAGSQAALLLFPAAWTLPLLARRRWPVPAAIAVIGALAVEAQVAYAGSESSAALIAIIIAFFTLGRRVETSSALISLALGLVLGVTIVAADAGPITASQITFLAIVSITPFAAGAALRSGERETADAQERAARAVAEERTRIARELHDMVGHAMSVVSLQAGAARLVLDKDPERAHAALVAIEDTTRDALAEMRRLIGILRDMGEPGTAPQPGVGEIERLVQSVRDAGLDVELHRDGTAGPIPPAVDLAAYRIVQEALTNALKHGRGGALVALHGSEDALGIEVTSSGTGPDADGANGHGLVGMRERVDHCGGTLEVGDVPGGFVVRARLPLRGERA